MTTTDTYQVRLARIEDGAVTTAHIGAFNPDELPPEGQAAWRQLGRRLALLREFDEAHPWLLRLEGVPVLRALYYRARLRFVLEREPA